MAGSNPIVGVDFQVDITSARANLGAFREELKRVNTSVSESKKALRSGGDEYDNLTKHVDNLRAKQKALSDVIGAQKDIVNALKSADGDHTKEINSKNKAIEKLEKQYSDVTSQLGQYASQLEKLNTPYQQLLRQQKAAEESVKALSDQYKSSVISTGADSEQSKQLAQALKAESDRAKQLKDDIARLDAETDELTGSTKAAESQQKSMSQTLADVSHAINIAREVYQALSKVIGDVGKEYIAADNAIRNTAATFGTSQITVEGMSDRLKEYNATLDHQYYSTQQEADALRYFALAGYDVEQSMDALGTALALAKISGNDMQTVVDQLTDNMNALGLEGVVTWREMADVMAQTSRTTNTNIQQLGDAYGVVGALWQEFPDDVYTLSTALGVLANAGFKGEQGGTKLRNAITKLINPTKDGAAAMKKLGVNVYNSDGSVRSLEQILKDLAGALDGLSDEKRQQVLTDLFNTRDLAAVEAILRAIESGDWDEVERSIREAEGAATEMGETITSGLGGSVDELKAKWSDLKVYLGEVFAPAANAAVNELTTLVKGLIHELRWFTDEDYRLSLTEPDEVTEMEMAVKDYLATADEANKATEKLSDEAQAYLKRTGQENAAVWYDMVEYMDWMPREHWIEQIASDLGVSTDRAKELYAELVKVGSRSKALVGDLKVITPKVDISQIKKATQEARDLIAKLSQTITVKANVKIPKVTLTTDDRGNINSMHYGDTTVSPYAKGGLLDRPTLALMGEAGKEAVVPLQNNLEWVDELARIITPVVGNAVAAVNRTDNRNYSRVTTVNQTINASRTDPFDLYLKSRMAY